MNKRLLLIIAAVSTLVILGTVWFAVAFIFNPQKTNTDNTTPTVSVTPSETTLADTTTATPTPTDTTTDTPSATPTPSPSPSPTPTAVTSQTKAFTCPGASTSGYPQITYTLTFPSDVTVTVASKSGQPCLVLLHKGSKLFMMFSNPTELYEQEGYVSAVDVQSSTITGLKRVKSKQIYSSSGSYQFIVAYTTSLLSGTQCTNPAMGNATTSPCASPAITIDKSKNWWSSVYCSVQDAYIPICDSIMKTVKISEK